MKLVNNPVISFAAMSIYSKETHFSAFFSIFDSNKHWQKNRGTCFLKITRFQQPGVLNIR